MDHDRGRAILLSALCGAVAGAFISLAGGSLLRSEPGSVTADAAVLAGLAEISDRLKGIHESLRADARSADPVRIEPVTQAHSQSADVASALQSVREELEQNAAVLRELSQRGATTERGFSPASASTTTSNSEAVASVVKALETTRSTTNRSYILKSPEDVLAEFGRPMEIMQNGAAVAWYYDGDGDGSADLRIDFMSGYVIFIDDT